jgi:hypothetical protein
MAEEAEDKNPFAELDPRVQEDIDGLIWLGHLQDTFSFAGHDFVMRTLRGDEDLAAGLITKEYVETLGQARAWAWAKVALSLVAIDGDDTFCPPIGHSKVDFARQRFQYVTSKWHWVLGAYLYQRYVDLEARQIEAVKAIENLSKGSQQGFMPSLDSLNEQENSVATTSTEFNTDS